ncbi:MAG: tetratricopeptide repeat protein [Anaerolineae bacterium]|nr:tetratricopeptide repeat protein [Anaerolineae bacterium]
MDQQIAELELRLEQLQPPLERVSTLNQLADHLLYSDPLRCLKLVTEARELAKAHTDQPGLALSLQNQCYVQRILGEHGLSIQAGLQALSLYMELGNRQQEATVLRVLGQIYADLGELPTALDYHLRAIDQFRSLEDQNGEARSLLYAGVTHSHAGDSQEAVNCYRQAIDLLVKLDNVHLQAVAWNSCCVDYAKLGQYAQAYEAGNCAMALFQQTDDRYGVAVTQSSLGEVALRSSDYQQAISLFEAALKGFKESRPDVLNAEMIETLLNLGKAWQQLGNPDQALGWLTRALTEAEKQQLNLLAIGCYQTLAQVYEDKGDPAAALTHYKRYMALHEKVMGENNQRTLANLRVMYETQEAQSESRRQKALREHEQQRFERLTQLRDDFLHHTTHDIKNPLTIIGTSSTLLRMRLKPTDEKIIEYLDQIEYGFTRIRQLLEDMLDLARLETLPALQLESVALQRWLESIVAEVKALAEAKHIHVQLEVLPPDLVIQCHPLRLQQAIVNLLTNAIKYTPEKGLVQIRVVQVENQVRIQVIDNGIGIPPEAIPRLFDRFYRVHNYPVSIEGTGLGLSIVKLAVEQHGGTVKVESEPGQGTVFTLLLPDDV